MENRKAHTVYTIKSLAERAGGTTRTVVATCESMVRLGGDVTLVSTDAEPEEDLLLPQEGMVDLKLIERSSIISRPYRFKQAVYHSVRHDKADLVHDQGVWLPENISSFWAANKAGVPYVLTPHGMLEPWALNHNAWKKNVAWHIYQHRILCNADLLHATAPAEAEHLRALGLDAPIVIAPNGVPLPETYKQSVNTAEPHRALFLSRIHPKKGLLNLMEAWAVVNPKDWVLTIAGPDERGHVSEVKARAEQLGIIDQVSFPGSIPDSEKWELYRESDLFILPTFSENFGVVVTEALASGIPVITTTGAPWGVLETHECGWWIEIGVDPLVTALQKAVTCSDEKRLDMGARGRALVKDRFTWPAVADILQKAYQWLLNPTMEHPEAVVPRGAEVKTTLQN